MHNKDSIMGVSLMVFLFFFCKGITGQDVGYTIEVNSSVSVQQGLCVTIPCKFTASYRSIFTDPFVYWKRSGSDSIVATNNNNLQTVQTNFRLTGNPDSGDCTLTLSNAAEGDAGTYYFRFEGNRGKSPIKWNYDKKITITVTGLTEEPVISDIGTVIAGVSKTLTCAPPGNCASASLHFQWKKSNDPGIWKTSSTITFTPSIDDDQKTITCEMTNAKGTTTQKSIVLHVRSITGQDLGYTIEVNSSVSVQQGLCITIPCKFTAGGKSTFTDPYVYWRHSGSNSIVATNNNNLQTVQTNFHLTGNPDSGDCTLTLSNAAEGDAGTYFFRFEGNRGNSPEKYSYMENKTTITVTDLTEKPVMSDLGKVIGGKNKIMTCTPPGNCTATSLAFQWKKSNVAGIWKNSSTITFTPSIEDDQETITCEMTNSKGKTTQKIILLNVYSASIAFKEETNVCMTRTMDSTIIIGMVIGNIAALVLINVGSYFFLKRRMEKRQLGTKITDPGKQGTESTYQELKRQDNDVYCNLKAQ